MYNNDSLRDAIRRAKQNIKNFREAIANEQSTIEEYKRIIEFNEQKARLNDHVSIEIVREDNGGTG